jgi:hypothetical protein
VWVTLQMPGGGQTVSGTVTYRFTPYPVSSYHIVGDVNFGPAPYPSGSCQVSAKVIA